MKTINVTRKQYDNLVTSGQIPPEPLWRSFLRNWHIGGVRVTGTTDQMQDLQKRLVKGNLIANGQN